MPVDPSSYSDSLVRVSSGLWRAKSEVDVSYPSWGHASLVQIEDDSFWFRHRNRCLVDLVNRFPPPGPIFDIGGGNGFVALALERAGHEVALVEPGREGAENALKRGVATVIRAEAQAAGFRPQSLPAVGMFDVLEHIEDDAGMLNWLGSRLASNNVLYLTVPAHRFLWSTNDDDAGHFRRYSSKMLAGKLEAAGFETDFMSYFFSPLVLPIAILRALPSRLRLPRTRKRERVARDHSPRAIGFVTKLLEREAERLAKEQRVRTGSSLLAVARRRS